MPAIIDSSPACVVQEQGTEESRVEDSADFVMGNNFEECAGFMTFGPGSTYGPEGTGAETAYMVLTWIGIVVMVLAILAWIIYENRRLIRYVVNHRGFAAPAPPQPGIAAPDDPEGSKLP
jgi:hypothetical protein